MFGKNHRSKETEKSLALELGKTWPIDKGMEPVETIRQEVLDYIVDLSETDYQKLLKLAKIYRDANKKADDIMAAATDGVDTDDSRVLSPQEIEAAEDKTLDDKLDAAFIDDDPKPSVAPKSIAINVEVTPQTPGNS